MLTLFTRIKLIHSDSLALVARQVLLLGIVGRLVAGLVGRGIYNFSQLGTCSAGWEGLYRLVIKLGFFGRGNWGFVQLEDFSAFAANGDTSTIYPHNYILVPKEGHWQASR